MARQSLAAVLAFCLLANGFCYPHMHRQKRADGDTDQRSTSEDPPTTTEQQASSSDNPSSNEVFPSFSDDDDDDFETMNTSSTGDGGSNIFSLLRIAGAILPSASNSRITSQALRYIIQKLVKLYQPPQIRRQFIADNEIEIDYIPDLKPPPPFLKQEETTNESNSGSKSESNESDDAAEESNESQKESNSKEGSESNDASVDNDSDYSDEPLGGGDGQGGGILGLLAGLSGGEDGQSDLGSLLATISGIVANLSGDGIDLNALIASGIGLFVGLLSEGEENPGAVIASYLLTSLDTITGGGSKNNGAFFGTFLSKLVKGTSAAGDPESSEENGNKMKMSDSAGFFSSFLVSLLGDMSKGSSGGSHPW